MTGFFLRALGLGTLLYFIFVMPIGRKTLAQAAGEVWEQTHLRHALEVKGSELKRELVIKMHKWQKSQALQGDIDADGHAIRIMDASDDGASDEADDADAPPVPRPRPPKKGRPKHSRGRPNGPQAAPTDDDHY